MKTELKNDFRKTIFQVDEWYSFCKNYGKCEKTKRYQVCCNKGRRNYLVLEPKYQTRKRFSDDLLAIGTKKYGYSLINLSILV